MNVVLWVFQVIFGLSFVTVGLLHLTLPAGLPPDMAWMYDLTTWASWIVGTAEILGGLGLILPAVFRTRTRLVSQAAAGLLLVMVLGVIFHLVRGEYPNVMINVVNGAVLAFIAWGRSAKYPLVEKEASA